MINNKIIRIFQIIGSAVFVFLMALIVANILTRSIFNYAIPGVYDIITTTVTVFGSCALVVTTYQRGHIIVDILTSHIPKSLQMICAVISEVVDIAFYALLCYGGYLFGVTKLISHETKDNLPIPVAPFRLFWALCAAVIVIVKIAQLIEVIKKKDTTHIGGKPDSMKEKKGGEAK